MRRQAHGPHAQAGGGAAEDPPGRDDDDDGDDEAEVQAGLAQEGQERGQLGELRGLRDARRFREARLRVGPRAVQERFHDQQGDGVEQERRDDLVDAQAHAQQGRHERPGGAGQGTCRDHQRQHHDGRPAVHDLADARRGDGAHEQLPFHADVPVAGPEGDGHRGPREEQRRGDVEDLPQRELACQGRDEVGDVGVQRVGAGDGEGAAGHGQDGHDGAHHDGSRAAEARLRGPPRLQRHAATSPRPAMSMPSCSGSASMAAMRPTTRPS